MKRKYRHWFHGKTIYKSNIVRYILLINQYRFSSIIYQLGINL